MEASFKKNYQVGDEAELDEGCYANYFAEEPPRIEAVFEFLATYETLETVAILLLREGNRAILTLALHPVTTQAIFKRLGISLDDLESISLKSRNHFRSGFQETGITEALAMIYTQGLGPAALSKIPSENVPQMCPLSGPDFNPKKYNLTKERFEK